MMKVLLGLVIVTTCYLLPAKADCPAGYYGGGSCSDINECYAASNCDSNAVCINTPGSYQCVCREGYVGDGKACGLPTCYDGNNGGCGNKKCTEVDSTVSCSCDSFLSASEDHLLARGKRVSMSSQFNNDFPGSKAVDGVYGVNGMAHAQRSVIEWMQIDLGESRCISAVKIWNRAGSLARRLQNVLITIGDDLSEVENTAINDNPAKCAYHPGQPADVQRFDCFERMFGRYVRVTRLNHNEYFHVFEIEVIGF